MTRRAVPSGNSDPRMSLTPPATRITRLSRPCRAVRRTLWPGSRIAALCVLVLVSGAGSVAVPAWGAQDEISADSIQKRLQQLEASATPDDPASAAIAAQYREALELLQRADEWAVRAVQFEREAKEAPALLESIRTELAQPVVEPVVTMGPDTALPQIEQTLAEVEASLTAARKRVEELQAEPTRRAERRAALATDMARLKEALVHAEDGLQAAVSADEAAATVEARRTRLLAERRALQRELEAAQQELASYEARTDLLPARLDRALRRRLEAEKLVAAWQAIALDRRRLEAEQATREIRRATRDIAPDAPRVLQELAAENQALAEDRSGPDGVTAKVEAASQQVSALKDNLVGLRADFRRTQRKVDAAGLTNAMGLLLRKQYEMLPNEGRLRRQARARQAQLADAQFRVILLEERRTEAGDIERQTTAILEEIAAERSSADAGQWETVLRDLLTARRDTLDALIKEYNLYFDRLVELDDIAGQWLAAAELYRAYIEERILWVRSVGRHLDYSPLALWDAFRWFTAPASWRAAWANTLSESGRSWPQTSAAALVALLLVAVRPVCRRQLHQTAASVGQPMRDGFLVTVQALALTALLAAPVPVLLWVVAWRLGVPADQPDVALAVAAALRVTAGYWFTLDLVRQVLRSEGLGERHFRWSDQSLRVIRRELRWFIAVIFPAIFLVVVMDRQPNDAWNDVVGRLAFVAGMLAFATVNRRLFSPTGPLLAAHVKRYRTGLLSRLIWLWYPLAIGLPLVFAILALLGYFYTAVQLQRRLDASTVLILSLILLDAVLFRWLFVVRQRLFLEQARARRAAATAAGTAETASVEEQKLSIPKVDAQTQRLFRSLTFTALLIGLYLIWASVLPALRMLERVEVWPDPGLVQPAQRPEAPLLDRAPAAATAMPPGSGQAGSVTPLPGGGVTPAASNTNHETSAPVELVPIEVEIITLADVGGALVILVITLIAARNLPGLLEIAFLRRLPLDAGSRYALNTIVQYAITIVGLTAVFGAVGVGWSKVQWLAAALTFGLAFGLQEIFANFVSGLIILAERPIRIGDTVTVANIAGTVARIRMRATTITDWDRKELIVPNKLFITDQLINWTLSDPILRVIIPVGVAYGSDVALTKATLLRVAEEHPDVLADPKPKALFVGFGDSSLNFELRVFIPNIDAWWPVKDGLHVAVDAAFREAGIEIAFPQRDLHVRSAPGLEHLVRREALPGPEDTGMAR